MASAGRVSLHRRLQILAVVAIVACAAVYCARLAGPPGPSTDHRRSSNETAEDERGLAGGVGDPISITERTRVGPCVLRLTSMFDGGPIGGVELLLFEGERSTYRAWSDENGDVLVPTAASGAEWQLRAQGVPVAAGSALVFEGREVLPIPVYPEAGIRMLVDGALLDVPLRLRLMAEALVVVPGMPAFSSAAGGEVDDPIALDLRSESGGVLRIPCMPMEWTGFLTIIDSGFRFAGVGDVLELGGSSLPESCWLTSDPAILGRVVDGETWQPAPGAEVGFRIVCARGGQDGSVVTGLDGRFRIPFQRGPLREAALTAIVPGRSYGGITVEGEYSESFDIGDIRLLPGRELHFEVVDSRHEPVEGAVVLCAGFRSPPADEAGATVLAGIPWEATSVSTYAPAYKEAVDPLGGVAEDGRMVITLERDTTLFLHLRSPGGASLPSARLVVSTGGPLFGGSNPARPHPVIEELSAGVLARSGCETTQSGILKSTLEVIPDSSQEVVLTGLVPLVPIRVEVLDTTGNVAGELDPVVLQTGEWRTETWTASNVARSFHAICLGPLGEVIAGARVHFGSDARPQHTASGKDGRIRIDGILVDALDLRIVAEGFATVVHEAVPVSAGTESAPFVILLAAGNRVSVQASDPEGGRVPLDTVEAWMGGALLARARSSPAGGLTFESLPVGRVEFRTTLLGRRLRREHDTSSPTAVFDVPSTGSLCVRFPAEPALGRTRSLEVYQADEPSCRILKEVSAEESEAGEVVLERIFVGSYGVRLYQTWEGRTVAKFATTQDAEVVTRARTEVTLVAR